MILLDTSVLVYAVGVDHPLRGPCRRLLEAVRLGRVTASTTPEVIQEFVHIHSQRRPREMAARLARGYVVGLAPLVLTEVEDVERGLRLFVEHAALGAFDSVFAAVALRTGAEALVSADRAFGAVRGLRYVDPGTRKLDQLLA